MKLERKLTSRSVSLVTALVFSLVVAPAEAAKDEKSPNSEVGAGEEPAEEDDGKGGNEISDEDLALSLLFASGCFLLDDGGATVGCSPFCLPLDFLRTGNVRSDGAELPARPIAMLFASGVAVISSFGDVEDIEAVLGFALVCASSELGGEYPVADDDGKDFSDLEVALDEGVRKEGRKDKSSSGAEMGCSSPEASAEDDG